MIQITDRIWLGNSHDAEHADLATPEIGAILNCAHDLVGKRGWKDGVEYAQCGLVDGPGNAMSDYHAVVLKACALVRRHRILIHCHKGESRSVFVVICALSVTEGRRGWDHWLDFIRGKVKAGGERELPAHVPLEAHRVAFDRMNWRLLISAMED